MSGTLEPDTPSYLAMMIVLLYPFLATPNCQEWVCYCIPSCEVVHSWPGMGVSKYTLPSRDAIPSWVSVGHANGMPGIATHETRLH